MYTYAQNLSMKEANELKRRSNIFRRSQLRFDL